MNPHHTRAGLVPLSELLSLPSRWTQYAFFRDSFGQACAEPIPDGQFCLVGALLYKHHMRGHFCPINPSEYIEPFSPDDIYADFKRDVMKAVHKLYPSYRPKDACEPPTAILSYWNDDEDRTWSEVIGLVQKVDI